ncbi:hypothetical protein DPSP01_002224 [Paraphaeosphaeria sporulosa]
MTDRSGLAWNKPGKASAGGEIYRCGVRPRRLSSGPEYCLLLLHGETSRASLGARTRKSKHRLVIHSNLPWMSTLCSFATPHLASYTLIAMSASHCFLVTDLQSQLYLIVFR